MCNAWNHSSSCTCGWGGTGHKGNNGWASHNYIKQTGNQTTWTIHKEGFCRPTKCPVCGAAVFFVRHNGGSVWFDELGKPWPKHGCFDSDYSAISTLTRLNAAALLARTPNYGIVIGVERGVFRGRNRVVVRSENNQLITAYVGEETEIASLVGELVVLSLEDRTIVHSHSIKVNLISPDSALDYFDVGQAYETLGYSDEAITAFRKVISIDSDFAEAYLRLGSIYKSLRDHYSKWQHIFPVSKPQCTRQDAVDAFFCAGEAHFKAKDYGWAIQAYKKVRLMKPTYPKLFCRMGTAYALSGNNVDAARCYEQALQLDATDEEAQRLMINYAAYLEKPALTPQQSKFVPRQRREQQIQQRENLNLRSSKKKRRGRQPPK